jgi:nucleotidyltransferase/DNA polymerase involved in DNA repair
MKRKQPRRVVFIDSPLPAAPDLGRFLALLEDYTPRVEYRSGCSAYLELPGEGERGEDPLETLVRLGRELASLGIPAVLGLGSNKFMARAGAELSGAGEALRVLPQGESDLLRGLPVDRWPGLRRKTVSQLFRLGIRRVGDLAAVDPFWVKRAWGKPGLALREQARGFDPRPVIRRVPPTDLSDLLPPPRLFPPRTKAEKLTVLKQLAAFLRRCHGPKAAVRPNPCSGGIWSP